MNYFSHLKYRFDAKANKGFCYICENETIFYKEEDWLRDHYLCLQCKSIPRHRILIKAIKETCPDFKKLQIHESSPAGVSSDYLRKNVPSYTISQYFPGVDSGAVVSGVECQNIEEMSFPDGVLDMFVSQDVFEHLLRPEKCLTEIRRVLKKGGYHIFTFPWYYWTKTTQRVVVDSQNNLTYPLEPVYHGNPVNSSGSIVTFDWGYDVVPFIDKHGFETKILKVVSKEYGLEAEFLEVFISKAV